MTLLLIVYLGRLIRSSQHNPVLPGAAALTDFELALNVVFLAGAGPLAREQRAESLTLEPSRLLLGAEANEGAVVRLLVFFLQVRGGEENTGSQ